MNREEVIAHLDALKLPWRKESAGVYLGNYGTFNRIARVRVGKRLVMLDLRINDAWLNVSRQPFAYIHKLERGNGKGKILIGTNPL